MKTDVPWRKVRYIEVLSDGDLLSGEGHWPLVDGWFEKAELLRPASPKGLVGGPGMITLPDGARFREVSFKTEHEIMELALPVWAQEAGRRWAKVVGDTLSLSDGSRWKKSDLRISGYARMNLVEKDRKKEQPKPIVIRVVGSLILLMLTTLWIVQHVD
jgi:hypothetical protein